ncbi:MAG: ATP-binding cassette domain-containing protein, partial [Candidatus Binatia bacterium]
VRAVTEATSATASGAVLLLGAYEVAAGRATPGTVVAAMTIVGLLVPALRDLGRVHEYWYGAQVSRRKIEEFLDTPSFVTEAVDAPDLRPGAGCLEFAGVSVSGVLSGVTGRVAPGTAVALMGPSGAGKSTLLSLAARLIAPEEGRILLDGQDLAAHSLASVRRAIGMVSPDLPLLRGTVEKNLRYRWPGAPVEEIARVRAWCGVDEVVAELPQGEQTRVTEEGGNLSVGQRQRIALARALLGNPAVLLLDEADANLDARARAVFDRILAEYRGTVLLVTHRPERLAAATVIWRLEAGHLIEVGAPVETRERGTYPQAVQL